MNLHRDYVISTAGLQILLGYSALFHD